MAKIKVNITGKAFTGKVVTFPAPCGCDQVTDGLVINGETYTVCDAMGECVTGKGGAWCAGAQISVVLDCENKKAYIQNNSNYAPAGYGLGEVVGSVFSTIEQVDAFKVSGVRAVSLTDGHNIGGSTAGKLVCVATARTYTQTFSFYYAGYGGLISLERVCTNELDWQEWEYVNPPMRTGAEYRTTERYNGEVVYKKLSSGGNPMWRPESSSTWRIPLDNSNMSALGCSQIQTGSYTGTGAYGSSSPSSLTFNFVPKMVVIQAVGASSRLMWFYGASVMQYRNTGSGWSGTVTANTKTFQWYGSSADMQANTSGQKYNWIAIG